MDDTLQGRLYRRLERAPGRNALAFIDSHGEYSWRTLEEILSQATGYGATLADLGLRCGDVCILVLPSEEFCATLLIGVLLVGAVPLLVAPPIIQAQGRYSNLPLVLKHVIRKTKPRMVILSSGMEDIRNELESSLKNTRFIFGQTSLSPDTRAAMPVLAPAETDLAAFQLTSGTTGFPRVCVWKQKSVVAALDNMALAMDLNTDDICLNWTPLYHDLGLVNNFFLCLTMGVPLAMLSPFDFVKKPALWLRGLSDTKSTLTWSPNFGLAITAERVTDDETIGVRLDRVRALADGAERVHLETIRAFYNRFACIGLRWESLKTNYGLAENIGVVTFSDPHSAIVVEPVNRLTLQQKGIAHPIKHPYDDRRTVAVVGVGRPCPGISIKILSRKGRALPDGHLGEIVLQTPSRMTGYSSDARATRKVICGSLLRTGDLGYMRKNELFWVGRIRERITVRGQKIDPSDFEQILLEIPGLRQGCFAAFGVDDDKLGTQRVIVIAEVRDPPPQNLREIPGKIHRLALLRLGVTVDDIVIVRAGTLTKTSSGKRRHRYFRELYMDGKLKDFEVSQSGHHERISNSAGTQKTPGLRRN